MHVNEREILLVFESAPLIDLMLDAMGFWLNLKNLAVDAKRGLARKLSF